MALYRPSKYSTGGYLNSVPLAGTGSNVDPRGAQPVPNELCRWFIWTYSHTLDTNSFTMCDVATWNISAADLISNLRLSTFILNVTDVLLSLELFSSLMLSIVLQLHSAVNSRQFSFLGILASSSPSISTDVSWRCYLHLNIKNWSYNTEDIITYFVHSIHVKGRLNQHW